MGRRGSESNGQFPQYGVQSLFEKKLKIEGGVLPTKNNTCCSFKCVSVLIGCFLLSDLPDVFGNNRAMKRCPLVVQGF